MALYEHRYDDWNAVDLITHRSRISHMMRVKAESSSSQKLTLFAAVPTVVVVVVWCIKDNSWKKLLRCAAAQLKENVCILTATKCCDSQFVRVVKTHRAERGKTHPLYAFSWGSENLEFGIKLTPPH